MSFQIRPLTLSVLMATSLVSSAFAQTRAQPSIADLDRLSQERQNEMPHRDWGQPVPQSAVPAPPPVHPLSVPVSCMGVAKSGEEIHLRPDAHSPVIGYAPTQTAATDERQNGWRKVMYTSSRAGWIPEADIVPFHPLVPTGLPHCLVAGARPSGMIVYDYTR